MVEVGQKIPTQSRKTGRHASFKQSRTVMIDRKGYLFFYDYKPNRKKVFIHRTVMETIIGRPLLVSEAVHHIDGNKSNNDPSNLELMPRSEHSRKHKMERLSKIQSNH